MGNVIVFGATGQLGQELVAQLTEYQNYDAVVCAPRTVDISDLAQVREFVHNARPRWILNAAAFTQVDTAQLQPQPAISTNAQGAANLALLAKETGACLVHFSTEAVFDGEKMHPYVETDQCHPLSVYAVSKLAGEQFIESIGPEAYILRTSWLYSSRGSSNFPWRLTKALADSNTVIPVVTDIVGNPTPVDLLARATREIMANTPPLGTYHVCCSDAVTKFDWAQTIAGSLGYPVERITPVTSSEFVTPAKRPPHVDLSCQKFLSLGLMDLPTWKSYYE